MVFAIVLTMPFLSLLSGAMTEKTLYADMPVEWAVSYDPRTDASDLVPESDNKALPFFSDGADTPYTFYTFLNSNQRAVYNTVKEKLFESSIDVALPSPLTWDGTSTSVPSNIKSALSEAVTGGLSALCDDYPMIFWINGYSISYGYSYHQTSSGYHFTISSVTVKPRINTNAYADMNKVKQDYNDMAAVVDSVEIKGATRYEKVKFIHDFICKRVEYDEKFEIPTAHEPTSVFLTPYKTVCEGYSESFKILCDKAGIPCVIAVGNSNGGGHAWNYVKMEDGKWYADAITWTAENGIFAGYDKDKFGPDDPITREQLAAIFYRYADYKGYDLTVKGNLDKFKDADKITDYAKTAMQWAVGSGLVKGKSGNLLDPQGTATRAEIAAMLHRFIEKYELVQGKAPGGLMGWIDPKRLQIPKTGDSSV